jgi:nitrogenase molybdenum-iron protein alpha/beta subunit
MRPRTTTRYKRVDLPCKLQRDLGKYLQFFSVFTSAVNNDATVFGRVHGVSNIIREIHVKYTQP